MIYAIIEASGKQIWVEPGKFYDLNKYTQQLSQQECHKITALFN